MIIKVIIDNQVIMLIIKISQKFLIDLLVMNLIKILLNFLVKRDYQPGIRIHYKYLNITIILKVSVKM